MSNYVEVAGRTGDQYLAALADSQERYLKFVAGWSKWMPKLPAVRKQSPTWSELAGAWFSFSEKLLAQQQAYCEQMLSATAFASAKPAKLAPAKPAPAKRTPAKPAPVKRMPAKRRAKVQAKAKITKSAAAKPVAKPGEPS
jgi:hypothetical protein